MLVFPDEVSYKGLCGLLPAGWQREIQKKKFPLEKRPSFVQFFPICLLKCAFTIFSIQYCRIYRCEAPSYFLHSISVNFSLFFSFCLILLSVFLSPILTSHSFVRSSAVAHYLHFNIPYIPPLFPLSLFTVAITVSMIFPLMCQIP